MVSQSLQRRKSANVNKAIFYVNNVNFQQIKERNEHGQRKRMQFLGKVPFLQIGCNLKDKKLAMQKSEESLLNKKINKYKDGRASLSVAVTDRNTGRYYDQSVGEQSPIHGGLILRVHTEFLKFPTVLYILWFSYTNILKI